MTPDLDRGFEKSDLKPAGAGSHVFTSGFFILLFSVTMWSAFAAAITQPFWNDEVFTAAVVQLGSVPKILHALQNGADPQPPGFYWLTYFTSFAASSKHVEFWMRLPGFIGFGVLLLTLYRFVLRAVQSRIAALLSIVILICSEAEFFSAEARPYGALLGCLGLSMMFWQNRRQGNTSFTNFVCLFLALTSICALHYYGLFTVMIYGMVELLLWFRSKKADWLVLCSLPLTLFPTILARPLVEVMRREFAASFWASPSLDALAKAYKFTFFFRNLEMGPMRTLAGIEVSLGLLMPLALILLCGVCLYRLYKSKMSILHQPKALLMNRELLSPDLLLVIGFVLLPLIVALASTKLGAFTGRYTIASIVGMSVLMAWCLSSLSRRFSYGIIIALSILFALHQIPETVRQTEQFRSDITPRDIAHAAFAPIYLRAEQAPVVIEEAHLFMEATYYADPNVRPHLIYLEDHHLALQFVHTDTAESAGDAIKPYFDIHLRNLESFLQQNHDFMIVTRDPKQWLTRYLLGSGARMTLLYFGYEVLPLNHYPLAVFRVRL